MNIARCERDYYRGQLANWSNPPPSLVTDLDKAQRIYNMLFNQYGVVEVIAKLEYLSCVLRKIRYLRLQHHRDRLAQDMLNIRQLNRTVTTARTMQTKSEDTHLAKQSLRDWLVVEELYNPANDNFRKAKINITSSISASTRYSQPSYSAILRKSDSLSNFRLLGRLLTQFRDTSYAAKAAQHAAKEPRRILFEVFRAKIYLELSSLLIATARLRTLIRGKVAGQDSGMFQTRTELQRTYARTKVRLAHLRNLELIVTALDPVNEDALCVISARCERLSDDKVNELLPKAHEELENLSKVRATEGAEYDSLRVEHRVAKRAMERDIRKNNPIRANSSNARSKKRTKASQSPRSDTSSPPVDAEDVASAGIGCKVSGNNEGRRFTQQLRLRLLDKPAGPEE